MDFVLIALLTLLNGGFAMSEMALAASKKARLQAQADAGDAGARSALELMAQPTQFLSTVQVGITSIGMLNGIVGEAAFSDDLAQGLMAWGVAPRWAQWTATALVVVLITFVTIVFGELVPKRIGQLYPEAVAQRVALPMMALARLVRPFVALLSQTTAAVLKLLRIDGSRAPQVTEEEIAASLEEGVDAGVIEVHEHRLVRNVLALDDRPLTSIMVPRADVAWLSAQATVHQAWEELPRSGHSWYPVCRGGLDDVVGVVSAARLMALREHSPEVRLAECAQPAVFVPETLSAMELLEQFRAKAMRLVLVVDEYGVVQGLLTPLDLLEAITGELQPETVQDAWAVAQPDGSWLVDGAMPVPELKARLGLEDDLPDEDKGHYNTVAGLMQTLAGRLLEVGEGVSCAGWRLVVQSLQGRRIERVLIVPQPASASEADGGQTATP